MDVCSEESTCETTVGGVCYAQYYSDVSGKHWTLRKGCLDDPSSLICHYSSQLNRNECCNDTDMCNINLFQITGEYQGYMETSPCPAQHNMKLDL